MAKKKKPGPGRPKGPKTLEIHVYVLPPVKEAMEQLAKKNKRGLSAQVVQAIEEQLQRNGYDVEALNQKADDEEADS